MARSHRKNSHKKTHYVNDRHWRRDAVAVARRNDYLESGSLPQLVPRTHIPRLSLVLDNRFYRPDFDPGDVRNTSGLPAQIGVTSYSRPVRKRMSARNPFKFLSPQIKFKEASRTVICLSRQRRKEVIHARGIAGSRVNKPRLNFNSRIHCK